MANVRGSTASTIDVKMVVFWCLQVAWQLQSTIRFPAGIFPGTRRCKKYSPERAWCQKAVGGIYFTKEAKSWDYTTWLRIWNFQTPA
jgi:hypothetical protein